MKEYGCVDTPIGRLCFLVSGRRVLALHAEERVESSGAVVGGRSAAALGRELLEYFGGKRRDFSFRPLLSGSGFKRKVLAEVIRVPYGSTTTYKDLAWRLSTSPRAVASVLRSNNVLILVPCHRVIHADGRVGGYALSPRAKLFLLELEASTVRLSS